MDRLKKRPKKGVRLLYYKWPIGSGNFGDELSPFLTGVLLNTRYCLTNEKTGSFVLVALGSYLHMAPPGCHVWGTGLRTNPPVEKTEYRVHKDLHVHAVRGPLTRRYLLNMGVPCPPVYGDPALLLPRFYRPDRIVALQDKVAVVAHITNYDHYAAHVLPKPFLLVNPTDPWRTVVQQIVSCKAVVSSALHGLIVADAYGVPNVWLNEHALPEADFKFRDYFASQGRDIVCITSLAKYDERLLYRGGNSVDLAALQAAFPFS